MKTLIVFLVVILFSYALKAANDNFPVGVRAVGMGNAIVANEDMWGVFNNVAGIARIQHISAGFFYERRYNFSGFNMGGVSAILPLSNTFLKYGGTGIGLYRFGDELYNESRFNFGFAHNIMGVNLGLQLEYLQVNIQEWGTKSNIALNFGGQAFITKTLRFGAHIYNINQARLSDNKDERIPTVMKAGLSYLPIEKLLVNIEMEKDIELPARFKAGLEFSIIKSFLLRTGINTNPQKIFLGAAYNNKIVEVGYSISFHQQLGFSHSFGLQYIFPGKKDKIINPVDSNK